MTRIFTDLASWLLFGVVGYMTSGQDAEFCLKFGLMDPGEFGEYEVRTETTHIPLHPSESEPEFRFGYTLEYADDRTFSSYFSSFFAKLEAE